MSPRVLVAVTVAWVAVVATIVTLALVTAEGLTRWAFLVLVAWAMWLGYAWARRQEARP